MAGIAPGLGPGRASAPPAAKRRRVGAARTSRALPPAGRTGPTAVDFSRGLLENVDSGTLHAPASEGLHTGVVCAACGWRQPEAEAAFVPVGDGATRHVCGSCLPVARLRQAGFGVRRRSPSPGLRSRSSSRGASSASSSSLGPNSP